MKTSRLLLLLVGAVILLTVPVKAQQYQTKRTASYPSAAFVEQMMDELKINYKPSGKDEYKLTFKGYEVHLYLSEKSIQLSAVFGHVANSIKINAFNKKTNFGRVYLNDDGDPVFESELNFEGGVSFEYILNFFRTYITTLNSFLNHLNGL